MVADATGKAVQTTHYYPFGMAFSEGTVQEQGKQPYKYNGKELDAMHGLNMYDYHARQMDPAIGRFTMVDPLAEKKTWISPYVYCSNNPINRIDPDGRDDYRLDRDGYLHFVKKTDAENHTLYATNSKGSLDKKNSLQVDKYVLDNKESVSGVQGMRSDGSIETSSLSIYTSAGDEKSTALFEFAANNTDVEWSHTKTTQNGMEVNYVSTGHKGNNDVSQSFLINRISKQNDRMAITGDFRVNIREANHSHPNDSRIVSQGDVNIATQLQSKFPNAIMHNYAIPSRIYTEFDMYSMPGLLPPIEIVAPALKKK